MVTNNLSFSKLATNTKVYFVHKNIYSRTMQFYGADENWSLRVGMQYDIAYLYILSNLHKGNSTKF